MSIALLIIGVFLWGLGHEKGAPIAENIGPSKAVSAVLIVLGVVAMTFGYRLYDYGDFATPPAFFTHINNLMVLIAIFMMSPAPKKGRLLNGVRHPMLIGFSLWAAAHLLVNWDGASIVMFSGLIFWAIKKIFEINRRDGGWSGRPEGSLAMDGAFALGSVILMGVIGYIHTLLGYWPFG